MSGAPRVVRAALHALLLVAVLPVTSVAVLAVVGLGSLRSLPLVISLVGAICACVLPPLGIVRTWGFRGPADLLAVGLWSVVLVGALPLYFPGERAEAVREGALWLARPLPQAVGPALAERAGTALAFWGAEPEAVPRLREVDELPGPPPAPRWRPASPSIVLEYQDEGGAGTMQVRVPVDGPEYGEELTLLFDTGASFTTLHHEVLEWLEIPLSSDAPVAHLQTANGEIEAALVLLDTVWVGGEPIEWVTAAVCRDCPIEGVQGLLGQNVTGRYQVAIDPDRRQITLEPRSFAGDRSVDIEPWLAVRSRALRWADGRSQIELGVDNRASQDVAHALFEIRCDGHHYGVSFERLPAGQQQWKRLSLPIDSECADYAATLAAARWRHSRFGGGGRTGD